jgi:CheY-like chemotaxis protein
VTDPARRLVVIDDSEIILAVMTPVLTAAGFEVRAVSSLRKFVNAVMDWKPHMIVTDLYMPEMSGAELCSWLRKQFATARTPVIICSSAPDEELARVAKEVGADGYVSKNAGPEALPAALHALCEEILF